MRSVRFGVSTTEDVIYIGFKNEGEIRQLAPMKFKCRALVRYLVTEHLRRVGFPKGHADIDVVLVRTKGIYLGVLLGWM